MRAIASARAAARASLFAFPGLGREVLRERVRHPVLGARLIECTELVNRISARSIDEIFGYPDDLKFRSSMTLFAERVAAS